ncbi:MAG: DUF1854 domain-containing protein, partial [Chloroflexi bacterium]|nr:DUF1854 domain-containing protein [Chloroflexota bacterium]
MDDHLLFLDPPLDPHIDRRRLHFRRGNWGLRLTVDGDRSFWRVRIRLADPLHHPNEFISVLINPDHELLLLDDLTDLDAESQRAIRQALDWVYT